MVQSMVPISTRVKHSICRGVGLPRATVRVMSVVPSGYWPPLSIRYRPRGFSLALLFFVGRVVDDRAVGRVAADGVEAAVLEALALGPERRQLVGGRDLGHAALGTAFSSHLRNFTMATPSRRWASVMPADLLGVLDRLHGRDRRGGEVEAGGP